MRCLVREMGENGEKFDIEDRSFGKDYIEVFDDDSDEDQNEIFSEDDSQDKSGQLTPMKSKSGIH